jgi:hypothetical protein
VGWVRLRGVRGDCGGATSGDELDRLTDPRVIREPPVREDRIGMPVRKHSIQLSYILFQPHSR